MTGVEMIKLLKSKGHKHIRVKGSHYQYNVNGNNFTVAHHHTEMGKGMENDIRKKAGLK
jgi:predicted RNA binding protein YcfA (HicA-like mRNA interferase family)